MARVGAFLGRMLLAASVVVWLAAPVGAQHGGGGHAGGGHGGGHAGSGHASGGHAGSTSSAGASSGHSSGSGQAAPMFGHGSFGPASASGGARPGSATHASGSAQATTPAFTGMYYVPAQAPTQSPSRLIFRGLTSPSSPRVQPSSRFGPMGMVAPMPMRVRSVGFVGSRPFPERVFFEPQPFCNRSFSFVGFGFGFHHHRHFLFGGFPLVAPFDCFFNGFNTVCFGQPFGNPFFGHAGFLSPFGSFGFAGVEAFETIDNSVAAPVGANDVGPYSSDIVPEAQPAQAASPTQNPLGVIVLTDGTAYEVTDYWLDGGRLHYLTSYGGENSIPLDRLNLEETVNQNWQHGITFTLRPEK
jgi:hypothetical protein